MGEEKLDLVARDKEGEDLDDVVEERRDQVEEQFGEDSNLRIVDEEGRQEEGSCTPLEVVEGEEWRGSDEPQFSLLSPEVAALPPQSWAPFSSSYPIHGSCDGSSTR